MSNDLSTNEEVSKSSLSILELGDEEGEFVPLTIAANNNQVQYRKDFPGNACGIAGNYYHHGNQAEFELEGAEPLGTRNVPRCLAGDFETEFGSRSAFGGSGLSGSIRMKRFWKTTKNLDQVGDGTAKEDAGWMTKDGEPILLSLEQRNVDGPLSGARSLHALLDLCYSEPDPKHRRKRIQKFREEHPEIYHEHFGVDVANDKPRVPEQKSKTGRRRCQIQ